MTSSPQENRRAHDRKPGSFAATVINGDERTECRLTDMSVSGAKIDGQIQTEQGARLVLDFGETGSIQCEVMWRSEGVIGVRFSQDIEEAIYLLSALTETNRTDPPAE
jgi:hypothetical protein